MSTKDFLNEYAAFVMESGLSKYSSDQYKSYLNNVCKKFVGIENHLNMIAESVDADEQGYYAEQMNAVISSALKKENFFISKKKLRDYKCAVALLIAYISNFDWIKGEGSTSKPILSCVSEYNRKDLRRIFLSRVKTQDRLSYSYGVFAARILCKIAARYKVKIFNKMIDEVKFLVASDANKFVCLKQIDKLMIAIDGYVYIESGGKIYSVYTEVVKNGISTGYEKAKVSTMRDLSLDHDTPLYHALYNALGTMPEYKKLSDSIKQYQKTCGKMTASNLSKTYLDSVYQGIRIDEKSLLDEIGAFIDNTEITIMLTSYNSSKSKNTP
jgi:hypothetical protein